MVACDLLRPIGAAALSQWHLHPDTHGRLPQRDERRLPAEAVVINPPVALADSEKWRRIGEEISERLDFEPGRGRWSRE